MDLHIKRAEISCSNYNVIIIITEEKPRKKDGLKVISSLHCCFTMLTIWKASDGNISNTHRMTYYNAWKK